jgi:hypothetical protein
MQTKNLNGYANKNMDDQFPFQKIIMIFQKVNTMWNFFEQ